MWNVSFVQYLRVPAFTECFGLVSIQFQISSGYLLNFHMGWQVILMSCAKIHILMKGLRGIYLAVWWGRDSQALSETPRRAEKRRRQVLSFYLTPVVMRTTDWFWPLNDLQWPNGDYYTPTQKWKPESDEENWAFCAGGVGSVMGMTIRLLVKDRLRGSLMWQSHLMISYKVLTSECQWETL